MIRWGFNKVEFANGYRGLIAEDDFRVSRRLDLMHMKEDTVGVKTCVISSYKGHLPYVFRGFWEYLDRLESGT